MMANGVAKIVVVVSSWFLLGLIFTIMGMSANMSDGAFEGLVFMAFMSSAAIVALIWGLLHLDWTDKGRE